MRLVPRHGNRKRDEMTRHNGEARCPCVGRRGGLDGACTERRVPCVICESARDERGSTGVAHMYTVRTHVGGTALAVIKRYTVSV
jgi:hypothetical protein